jgi:hypothetical protein
MKRKTFKKVYAQGGNLVDPKMGMFGSLAGLGSGVLDGLSTGSGAPSLGLAGAKGALSGVAAGAQFGPIGAGIGGAIGLATGLINGAKMKKEERQNKAAMNQQLYRDDLARSQAALAGDPSLSQGNKGVSYYAMGGTLAGNSMNGIKQLNGKLRPISSNNTIVEGPSHEQGGVDLPEMGAELEGGETTAGPRVFSEELGYAKIHKPIARAIGKIEKKAPTLERINGLKRLREREDALYNEQETLKQYLNL